MGVDCAISLPSDVRAGDVANVIGILSGCRKEWAVGGSARWVDVGGVRVESAASPECARIVIESPDHGRHQVLFHFEWSAPVFGKGLMPSATSYWCAVGHALVKFFGGAVDYNDCDDSDVDFKARRPRKRNNPEGGKAWENFQQALWELEPLSPEEIAEFDSVSAYGNV